MPINLAKRFVDHVQDLNVSGWLPRTCEPFRAERDTDKVTEDDDWTENHFWMLHTARRRRPRRGVRADSGLESDDAMQHTALGSTSSGHDRLSPCAVSRQGGPAVETAGNIDDARNHLR